jgi:hypothetical protein
MKTYLRALGLFALSIVIVRYAGKSVSHRLPPPGISGWQTESLVTLDDPLTGLGLKKSKKTNMGSWNVQTNRWGFRDSEDFPLAKDSNEVRIFLVGGTSVFGWGVENSATVPSYLQAAIDSSLSKIPGGTTKRIRVINAGCPLYASGKEATSIYFKVLDFSPDWIIVLDGNADAGEALKGSSIDVWDRYLRNMERVTHLTHDMGIRFSIYYEPQVDFRPTYSEAYLDGEKRLLTDSFLAITSLRKFDSNNETIAQAIFDHEIAKELPKLISSRLASAISFQ